MKRKILTVLLALVMVVGLISIAGATEGPVAQIGEATYATLTEAVSAAQDGETVTLLRDTTVGVAGTFNFWVNKSITVDLGGNTLTGAYQLTFGVNNKDAVVTVKNGKMSGGSVAEVYLTAGTLYMDNITINSTAGSSVVQNVQGDLYLDHCTIDTQVAGAGGIWDFTTNHKTVINDSTISVKDTLAVFHNGSTGGFELEVTNSTLECTNAQAVYISGSTKTTAEAGKNQQAKFTGCTITGTTGIEGKFTDIVLNNCKVTATAQAPTFEQYNNGTTTSGFAVVSTDNSMAPASPTPTAKIEINGGEYTGLVGLSQLINSEEYPDFEEATYEVTGGEFTSDPTTYVTGEAPVAEIVADQTTSYAVGSTSIANAANNGEAVTVIKAGEITGLEAGKTINVADGVTGVTVNGNAVEANASYTEPVPIPAYSVKVAAAENGTVTSNRRSATRGQTVTLTVSPADGYALDSLTVTDAKGNEIELTDKGDGKYTFKMPASRVTVTATFKKAPIFTDIDGRWYTPYIEWAAENDIALDEDGSGLFHPDADCSRAAIVTFLWRAFGSQEPTITECPFTDVSESDSWYKAVLWAYENKITVGYDDPTVFAPDATSERAQTLTFLKRAVKAADVETGNDFTDVPEGAWYEAAVNWGVSEGLTNGYDDPTVFAPHEDCSRAEIIAFIYRLLAK